MMSMYDEYEAFTKKYQDQFGKDTIVLYQCGGFYEVYSVDDGLIDIRKVADILDVQLSKRNKKDPVMNRANCLFLGWPLVALNKYIPVLIEHNYTVVLVNQVEKSDGVEEMGKTKNKNQNKNKKEVREVTQVISKGTFIENVEANESHGRFIVCIYVEKCAEGKTIDALTALTAFAFGVSIIEVSTGVSMYKEILPCASDHLYTSDELYRITSRFPASELIITSSFHKDMIDARDIVKCLKINASCHVIDRLCKMNVDLAKIHRQNLVLSRVFPDTRMLSPIEFLDLERLHFARISYVFLMEYLFLHNESIVIKLQPPEVIDRCERYERYEQYEIDIHDDMSRTSSSNSHNSHSHSHSHHHYTRPLILSYNAIDQLDVASGLLQMLNKCQTLMGRRYFRDRLVNPTYDETILFRSYEAVHNFVSRGVPFIEKVRKELKNIYDLERLFRKILMGKCKLNDLSHLSQSLSALLKIFELCDGQAQTNAIVIEYAESVLGFLKPLLSTSCSPSTSPSSSWDCGLNLDAFPKIKEWMSQGEAKKNELHSCVAALNGFCDDSFMNQSGQACFFRLERNDRDGYFLVCTSKRLGLIKDKLVGYRQENHGNFSFDNATISPRGEGFKLAHPYFIACTQELERLDDVIEADTHRELCRIMTHISDNFAHTMKPLCDEVNSTDFHSNNAFIALIKNYCRPTMMKIEEKEEKEGINNDRRTLSCTELRHPLVEGADQSVAFVGNDIEIGPDNNLLLYGLNAAGKSTLMKSIALGVIMAQAGMYVPASSFHFTPFRSLFTRITKGDDLQKQQSTFMIEMQELRSILKRADAHSLVVGDELCCGTESASAVGIVAAGLKTLTEKNMCTFVFTTHLHDLTSMSCIENLMMNGRLQVCHLHVEYNPDSQVLVYDRKLRKGQGLRIYGIEVCRALQIDQSFIELANSVRNEYAKKSIDQKTCPHSNYHSTSLSPSLSPSKFHLFQEPKRSRYNSQLYLTVCSVCGMKADEVHHIEEQHKADQNGFIDKTHKNQLSNLVGLCASCHDKVHDEQMKIDGYVKTSEGVKLMLIENESIPKDMGRNTEPIDDVIKRYRFKEKRSIKEISSLTFLSVYKINKILQE